MRIASLACFALLAAQSLTGCESLPARGDAQPHPPVPPPDVSVSAQQPPVASATSVVPARVPEPETALRAGGKHAVHGETGMVSSEDPLASDVGARVLASGGNAIDAAVAMGYTLAVTHHVAGSLGGGGFMIVRLANGQVHAIDYREVAPAKATVELNEKQLDAGAHGYLSAPVPGTVAGFNFARDRFGSKPLAELIAPAIRLAEEGHRYGLRQATVLAWFWKRLRDPHLRKLLGRGKDPIGVGYKLKQPDLAKTLRAIAEHGNAGFYEGPVADAIVKAMEKNGGLVTAADLKAYEPKLREPLGFVYRGYQLYTMPPPSMGGIALLSIMNLLAQSHADLAPQGSASSLHLFIEASRRAYADRRAIGADPAFVGDEVAPLRAKLLDPAYYAKRLPPTSPNKATPSTEVTPIHDPGTAAHESSETTHFSVVDAQGNAVSCTTTLSAAFGAWLVVPGTGVLLSNAMGAFSPDGVNTLAPGKRMASSMTPVIVLSRGEPAIVIGSPGGDTIPNTVAQVLRNLIDYGMTIDEAIEAGRVHHQYLPDEVRTEKERAPSRAVAKALEKMGHKLAPSPIPIGDANGILVEVGKKSFWGHSDTRKGGTAVAPTAPKGVAESKP